MDHDTALFSLRDAALGTAVQRARDVLDQACGLLQTRSGTLVSTPITREALAKALLKGRRRRADVISGVDFGEPAWDMLLELYVSHCGGHDLGVADLCVGSGVPATTALRWIAKLEATGHIERSNHPHDRRRHSLYISEQTFGVVDRWLHDMLAMLG